MTANGMEIAEAALRLLVRTCHRVTVALPAGTAMLRERLEAVARGITMDQRVSFVAEPHAYARYDAILCVGATAQSQLPWTVVNSKRGSCPNWWCSSVGASRSRSALPIAP